MGQFEGDEIDRDNGLSPEWDKGIALRELIRREEEIRAQILNPSCPSGRVKQLLEEFEERERRYVAAHILGPFFDREGFLEPVEEFMPESRKIFPGGRGIIYIKDSLDRDQPHCAACGDYASPVDGCKRCHDGHGIPWLRGRDILGNWEGMYPPEREEWIESYRQRREGWGFPELFDDYPVLETRVIIDLIRNAFGQFPTPAEAIIVPDVEGNRWGVGLWPHPRDWDKLGFVGVSKIPWEQINEMYQGGREPWKPVYWEDLGLRMTKNSGGMAEFLPWRVGEARTTRAKDGGSRTGLITGWTEEGRFVTGSSKQITTAERNKLLGDALRRRKMDLPPEVWTAFEAAVLVGSPYSVAPVISEEDPEMEKKVVLTGNLFNDLRGISSTFGIQRLVEINSSNGMEAREESLYCPGCGTLHDVFVGCTGCMQSNRVPHYRTLRDVVSECTEQGYVSESDLDGLGRVEDPLFVCLHKDESGMDAVTEIMAFWEGGAIGIIPRVPLGEAVRMEEIRFLRPEGQEDNPTASQYVVSFDFEKGVFYVSEVDIHGGRFNSEARKLSEFPWVFRLVNGKGGNLDGKSLAQLLKRKALIPIGIDETVLRRYS